MNLRSGGLSLRSRLTLALVGIAVVFLLGSLASIAAVTRLGGSVGTILRENYASVVAANDMNESLERLDSAALFAATGQVEMGRAMMAQHRPLFESALEREEGNVTLPGERELAAQVRAGYASYVAATDRLLATPESLATGGYFRELLPRFNRLRTDVQAIRQLNQDAMLAADRRAHQAARDTTRAALLSGALALALASGLVFWLPRALVRPVAALRDAVVRMGEGLTSGDLTGEVERPAVAELVPLADAFNAMLARLHAYRESSLGELLAAQDLAHTAIASLIDPVMVVGPEGSVRLANEAAGRAFDITEGLPRAELVARLPEGLLASADQAAQQGQPVLPGSLSQAVRQPGVDGERFFLVRATPLSSSAEPAGQSVLVVAQDVTRLHHIDELKSNVVATVSHEFKTPLTSLRMATHLLLQPSLGPLTEAQQELVTTACDDTERLRLLVEKFLDLTRIEAEAGALRRIAVSPDRLLASVVDAHQSLANARGVELGVVSGQEGDVVLDPDKMGMALSNLVVNALQHTPSGGHVRVEAQREDRHLVLRVSDTGEGIETEDLPRIFERFHRGSGVVEDHHRLGLGLSITREVVRQHGGEVVVESRRGHGATFTLTIPVE